jgi:hypothetical protein
MAKNKEADQPRRKKLSAFVLAINSPTITAEIDVRNVLEACPNWTEQQAAEFLREHADVIGGAMAVRGSEMLYYILGGGSNVQ